MKAPDKNSFETFPKPNPERDFIVRMRLPEFTCLCLKTSQPDLAEPRLEYVPAELCNDGRRIPAFAKRMIPRPILTPRL